ncbi:hypothetical protein BCR36DRAFT_581330 [Piromyces finnis]|uniref:GRIP domain-containing protein n=1 Tax=Piromyces finnis TaxID=1754191 RepID=A0A1Y1VGL5_9FUNG|nr:hypothetical protein BCR36DRAFT_581330 [Piromyces finnis]|eukprot:ORX55290.1 hypothetical protein BCR36DRAFT_581330 [Piromyces finnis]
MSNAISIEEFNALQEKLQNTISQTFDYKKQIEKLTKELEKEKESKLKDKASAGINSFLNTLKKGNLADENEKLKAEIELLNDFRVQNEALKNHIHSLTNKFDNEISILKSELNNYKLNEENQNNNKINIQGKNTENSIQGGDEIKNFINSIEKLKEKHISDLSNINDHINNFKLSTFDNISDNDRISSLKIFQNFKEEIKFLNNNYSILQYKDLESEEIGKVILNVNNYLNELKQTTIEKFSQHINNNFIEKQKFLDFKTDYENIISQNKNLSSELAELMIEITNEKQELMRKVNNFQDKNKKKENNTLNEKIEANNDDEENNEIEENNNNDINNNSNDDDNNGTDDTKDIENIKKTNDTPIDINELSEVEVNIFYNEIIKSFEENINKLNTNINKLKEKLNVNELNYNEDKIDNINISIDEIYDNNIKGLVREYTENNFGLNPIMSKNSSSVQEFNKLYNNKFDFIMEKYENQYKEELEENNKITKNNTFNIEEFDKLKNEIKNIHEDSVKEFNELSNKLCYDIQMNKSIYNQGEKIEYDESQQENNNNVVNVNTNVNTDDENKIDEIDTNENKTKDDKNNNSNVDVIDNSSNNHNQITNEELEKRISEARMEIKQQIENQMVEEKQAFVKSLRAGFENEKLQLEKVLHDEFEIEINRILDEHYTTNKEKDAKIEKLSKENEVMSKDLANIRYDLAKSNTKCRQKQEEAENYQKINNNITIELNKAREEINNYETRIINEKRVLLDEIDQYKDHISVIEKAKVDLSKRFDEEFMTKESEINRVRQKIDELMRENYSLEEKFNIKARQTESIQATMLMNQEELEQVKENHSKLNEKYETLNSKYNTLLKEFDVSKANCDRNSKNILESQEMVKEFKKKAVELSQTNEESVKKINELEYLYKNSKKQLEEITKIKEEEEIELRKLKEESETMSKEIKNISEKNELLIKENKELENKWHETENELRVSDRKKIQVIKDLQKQLIKERKSQIKSGDSTDSISTMASPNPSYSSPKLVELPMKSSNHINNQEISDNQSSYSASSSYVRKASKTIEPLSSSPLLESPTPESTFSNSSAKTTKRKLTPEEKIKVLLLRNKKLNEELSTKSKILQQYILQEHSAELQPDNVNKPKLFNIGILSNQKLLQKTDPLIVTQINQKLQKLVEELTTKNMVLKEELDKAKSSSN